MTSTPPPPSRIRTPPTPLHGPKYDSYEPYSPPRRSIRVRTNESCAATSPSDNKQSWPSPRSRKVDSHWQESSQTASPPPSPVIGNDSRLTPTKDTTLLMTVAKSERDMLSAEAAASLPTPRKTPRKRDAERPKGTGRVLDFHHITQNIPAQPPRRRQRLTLDSPSESPRSVVIYTDSQDRVPEADTSDDNPFAASAAAVRSRQRTKRPVRLSTEEQAMHEAVENNEGMIYMFRGRKMLRRFSDAVDDSTETRPTHALSGQTARIRHLAGPSAHRPITRSSLQPRLLFPPQDERVVREEALDHEEALTDIEEHDADEFAQDASSAVLIKHRESSDQLSSQGSSTSSKKPSPFDSWPRQKPGARHAAQGVKRPAQDNADANVGKRTRSHGGVA